jgi:type IV pilus assembly protein PilV
LASYKLKDGRNSNGNSRQGFSLLEVLIAIVVLSIGLLSLSSMQVYAIKGNGLARMSTQATYLAQHMLERIKTGDMVDDGIFGFIDMSVLSPGTVLDEGMLFKRRQDGATGGPFDVQWQVTSNTNWSRRIVVNVSWYGGDRKRMVSLASISRGDGY